MEQVNRPQSLADFTATSSADEGIERLRGWPIGCRSICPLCNDEYLNTWRIFTAISSADEGMGGLYPTCWLAAVAIIWAGLSRR